MSDPIRELKIRAERLQRSLEAKDPASLPRLRALRELRRADEAALRAAVPGLQRKECLAIVAREAGFESWTHALAVLEADGPVEDFGSALYGATWGAFVHPWFARYDEAKAAQAATAERTWLLAWRRHFFLAGADFVAALGLDPDDPDWAKIGWDWVSPADPDARRRLYGRRLQAS